MTEPDPVRDVIRVVYVQAFTAGAAAEKRRGRGWAFTRGVVIGMALTLLTIGLAVAQIPPRANDYRRDLTRISRSVWGMNAPVSSLAAQIHQESRWRPDAVSPARAKGLTQFIDATAAGIAAQYPDLQPVAQFDPRWAMLAQSRLMLQLVAGHRAVDDCERYAKALASYNQGPRWTLAAEAVADDPLRWFGSLEQINPGKAPAAFYETRGYVRSILLVYTPMYYSAQWGPGHCLPKFWRWS